jgi:hypothetical protein
MMAIKLKLTNIIDISKFQHQFNCVVRYAYNRYKEGKEDIEIRKLCKKLHNIDDMDASWIHFAVLRAKWVYLKDKEMTVVFGGKKNFENLSKNKITKEEYKKNRLAPILSIGSCNEKCGNRKIELDIIENNRIIFKQNKNTHIILELPKLKKKYKEMLFKVEELARNHEIPVTFRLTNDYISIIFDETIFQKEYTNYKPGRILSLDMNPNYVGISICDYNTNNRQRIILKQIITNKKINDIDTKGLSTKHPENIYKTNKRIHETYEINKYIVKLAKTYHCEWITYEQLETLSKDNKKGRKYNKLVNNQWNRTRMRENLIKLCIIEKIKTQEIASQYSSFIGCINHPIEIDSIAASLEINRRSNLFIKIYKTKILEKTDVVFPGITKELILNRWKDDGLVDKDLVNWKTLYSWVKTRKLNYRVLFSVNKTKSSFRLKSNKSLVRVYLL